MCSFMDREFKIQIQVLYYYISLKIGIETNCSNKEIETICLNKVIFYISKSSDEVF